MQVWQFENCKRRKIKTVQAKGKDYDCCQKSAVT